MASMQAGALAAHGASCPSHLPIHASPPSCPCSKVGVGLLRSSLFLSLYCTLAWRGACTGFTASGRTTGGVIAASCWVAGLAVLVEKRSRRMELALYCLSRVRVMWLRCLPALGGQRELLLRRRGWLQGCSSPTQPCSALPFPRLPHAGRGIICAVLRGVGAGAAGRAAAPRRRAALLAGRRLHLPLLQRPLRAAARRLPLQLPQRL